MNIEKLRDIYKLKHIVRYNTRRHLKDESVAEHSFYVALISLLICEENKFDDKITKDAVIKALLHDMPEIELNDITHDAKEKLKIRNYLKKYEDEYFRDNFPEYAALMIHNKGIASTVVEIADAMSVLQYTDNEQQMGNVDSDIEDIRQNSISRIEYNINKLNSQLKRRKRYDKEKQAKTNSDEQET